MDSEKKHNKHSIRDIAISRKSRKTSSNLSKLHKVKPKNIEGNNKYRSRKFKRKGIGLIFIASILLFFSASFLLYTFLRPTSATVEVVATVKEVPLSEDYIHVAYKEPEPGQLGFKVFENNFIETKKIKADKEEYSEDKASGILTVYNDYSNKPQRIIRNTRFQSPDGKIYRVKKPFIIPAKTNNKPGQTEVRVYADEPGQEYNLKAGVKFTLPALSGEAAKGIYAISKTNIKGGFKGKRASVSEEKKESTINQLKEKLKDKALSKALSILGKNYLSFRDAVIIEFDEPELDYQTDSLNIKLKAKALVPAFNKYDFARELLSSADAELDFDSDSKIYIDNLEDLDLKLINKDSFNIEEDEILKFLAKGTAKAKYTIDNEAIKLELADKNETVVKFLKEAYPSIEDINASIEPIWRDRFPENPDKIKIVEILR